MSGRVEADTSKFRRDSKKSLGGTRKVPGEGDGGFNPPTPIVIAAVDDAASARGRASSAARRTALTHPTRRPHTPVTRAHMWCARA